MHEINELRYEPKDYVVICLSTLYFRITILFSYGSEDGGIFSNDIKLYIFCVLSLVFLETVLFETILIVE